MKERNVPDGFISYSEYEDYCRCINNTSIGDTVEFYVNSNGNPHYAKSNRTKSATVIAMKNLSLATCHKLIVIANNGMDIFWSATNMDNLGYNTGLNLENAILMENIFLTYKRFWSITSSYDGRIIKITRPAKIVPA